VREGNISVFISYVSPLLVPYKRFAHSTNNFTNGALKKKLYRNVVVFAAVTIHILVFSVVTQYRLVGEHQRLDGKYFLFIEG